ncbi:MAG: hypothetical protein HUJ56_12120 [Erysipelotrichaceae bacterium]|nr:hypothetical protein [Erysipelotrichaceae bacterium]
MQLDEEFILFEQYNVSPNEYFFIQNILLSQEGADTFSRYMKLPESVRGSIRDLLQSLKDKGIILSSYTIPQKGESFNPTQIPLSKRFTNTYMKLSMDMFLELWETYPLSGIFDGTEWKLRTVSKKFNSREDAAREYGKAIGWNANLHKHILELVEYGKSNNYNFTTLERFIIDADWDNLEEMQESSILGSSNLRQL